jgi:signal transduction histidine kinase
MLRTRLYLGLLPLLLLLCGTGAYAIRVCRQLAGLLQRDLVGNYQAMLASQQMRYSAQLMTDSLSLVQSGDLLRARRAFESNRADFTHELMTQSARLAGTPDIHLVEALDAAFTDLTRQGTALLTAGGSGSLEALQRNEAALFRVLTAIEKLNQRDFSAAQLAAARAGRLAATTERVLLIAIAAAAVLSLLVAWRLASSLLGPIKQLTASAAALGEGRLEHDVPVLSDDELGRLARTFNVMADKLRAYRDAMREEVRQAQRTTEATLTASPDPVLVFAPDGRVTLRNPAAEALDSDARLPPALREAVHRVLESGRHDLPTGYDRVITLRRGADDRHFLPRILAVTDQMTGIAGAALILQDITRFRLLDDAKSNLVGTVSHELKTPLTSLRMAVYLLLEQNLELTPTQRELLDTARDEADRLLRVLNDLLDLSRLESGVIALERQPAAPSELLAAAAREMQPIIDAAEQMLVVRVAPNLPPVGVDAGRLRHVFLNLLANASKYTPAGGEITLYAEPADDGFVRFGVRDQGPGVAPQYAARLFDKFFRAPGQEKHGAGLGLAIAREVVVAHGGSIACASEPGKGSDFHFLLPR